MRNIDSGTRSFVMAAALAAVAWVGLSLPAGAAPVRGSGTSYHDPFATSLGCGMFSRAWCGFRFPNPSAGGWYDPPFVHDFSYALEGGGTFIGVTTDPDPTFAPADVVVGGTTVATLMPGESYTFTTPVTFFDILVELAITPIEPNVDLVYPVSLDFTGPVTALDITVDIPEPPLLPLLALGLAALAVTGRARRQA